MNVTPKQCSAITEAGSQCTRNAVGNSEYCKQHKSHSVSTSGAAVDNAFRELPEAVYAHLTAQYRHQDQLSWGRTQLLFAIEVGTLAAAFSLRPLAVPVLIFGTFLVSAIWLLVERDWEVRDQDQKLLDKVNKPLRVCMAIEPRYTWRRGSNILRVVFWGLIAVNIVLIGLFVLASYCECKPLDVFRSNVGG
jgi:hypothetical protein